MSNARLRLAFAGEVAERLVREADQWKGSGGTGRFPQLLRSDILKASASRPLSPRTTGERLIGLSHRREELLPAEHALELLAPEDLVEHLDARVRRVARHLLDAVVALRHARDLREMRDREHL